MTSHVISGLTIALLTVALLWQSLPANGQSKFYAGGECWQPKKASVLREFVKL